jgi:hypothetical protein
VEVVQTVALALGQLLTLMHALALRLRMGEADIKDDAVGVCELLGEAECVPDSGGDSLPEAHALSVGEMEEVEHCVAVMLPVREPLKEELALCVDETVEERHNVLEPLPVRDTQVEPERVKVTEDVEQCEGDGLVLREPNRLLLGESLALSVLELEAE